MAKSDTNNGALKPGEQSAKLADVTAVYLSYTPCYFSHNGTDYHLHNNETYQLPNCPFVQSLIGQGKLVEKNK